MNGDVNKLGNITLHVDMKEIYGIFYGLQNGERKWGLPLGYFLRRGVSEPDPKTMAASGLLFPGIDLKKILWLQSSAVVVQLVSAPSSVVKEADSSSSRAHTFLLLFSTMYVQNTLSL